MNHSSLLPDELRDALIAAPIDQALAECVRFFGCQAGTFHRADGPSLHLAASFQIPPQVLLLIQHVPVGKGIAGLAAQRLAPVSICNLQTDSSGQARPGALQTGMEGSLAVPAIAPDGELRGVLGIAKAQAHDWSEDEKSLVSACASILASRDS